MTDAARFELRRGHDESLRALDAARRAQRKRETIERRIAAVRGRGAAPVPAVAGDEIVPPLTTLAAWEPLFRIEGAARRNALATAMAAAVIDAEEKREIALLEECLVALPAVAKRTKLANRTKKKTDTNNVEDSRSEAFRALLAVEGDLKALVEGIRLLERAEWEIARCRDCLAPVKVDFLFDLRGGGVHHELAKSGRLDAAREYAFGSRAALIRAEVAVSAVSGAALPLDDEPFSAAHFWRSIFRDFVVDGYVTTATQALRAEVEALHAIVSPLRTREREAHRDARSIEKTLADRTREADLA